MATLPDLVKLEVISKTSEHRQKQPVLLCCVSLQNCRSISIIAHLVQLQTKFTHVFI